MHSRTMGNHHGEFDFEMDGETLLQHKVPLMAYPQVLLRRMSVGVPLPVAARMAT